MNELYDLTEILKKVVKSAESVLYLASNDESRANAWAKELDKLEVEIDFAHEWIINHPE